MILRKNSGDPDIKFYTKKTLLIVAEGYQRVVIGERGAFIEFTGDNIKMGNISIPPYARYRPDSKTVYFVEYRTLSDNVMIYFQKRLVKYADYKIGFFYIAIGDLITNKGLIVINLKDEEPEITLDNFII